MVKSSRKYILHYTSSLNKQCFRQCRDIDLVDFQVSVTMTLAFVLTNICQKTIAQIVFQIERCLTAAQKDTRCFIRLVVVMLSLIILLYLRVQFLLQFVVVFTIADTAFCFRALFCRLRLDVILQRGHLAQPQLLLTQAHTHSVTHTASHTDQAENNLQDTSQTQVCVRVRSIGASPAATVHTGRFRQHCTKSLSGGSQGD